jgi:exodeoxyribonuclease VIII
MLTNDNYHQDRNYISASGLKQIAKSPRHYWNKYLNKDYKEEPTAAMLFGNVVHTLILEPKEFNVRYAVAPDVNKTTKDGKAAYTAFTEANEGKEFISSKDFTTATAMIEQAKLNPIVTDLLDLSEKEAMHTFRILEVDCKMKADAINIFDGCIIDIKTCQDASPDGFGKACWNENYLLQAAFYLDGYYFATNNDLKRFIFIAMEKTAPFNVAVYEMDREQIELGRQQYLAALQTYKNCLASNDWHAYGKEIQPLQLPYWAK